MGDDDVSVTVRSKSGEHESVSRGTFRAWKRRVGGDKALMLQVPNSEGALVQTRCEFQALPPDKYEAELLQRVKLPSRITRGELKGCDAWKCI